MKTDMDWFEPNRIGRKIRVIWNDKDLSHEIVGAILPTKPNVEAWCAALFLVLDENGRYMLNDEKDVLQVMAQGKAYWEYI